MSRVWINFMLCKEQTVLHLQEIVLVFGGYFALTHFALWCLRVLLGVVLRDVLSSLFFLGLLGTTIWAGRGSC